MAILKERCPNCGGTILLLDQSNTGECDSCGMTYSLSDLQKIKETQIASERNAVKSDDLVENVKEVDTVSIEELCKKAEMALESEQWQLAYSFSNEIIRRNPKFAKAYLYRLLADYRVFRKEELENCEKPFDENDNYRLLIRFADVYLKTEIENYSETVKIKYRTKILEDYYQSLCRQVLVATTKSDFQNLANSFYKLGNYKDSKKLFEECMKTINKKNNQEKARIRKKKIFSTIIILVIVATLVVGIVLWQASYRTELFSIQVTNKINDTYDDDRVYCSFKFEIKNDSSHNVTYIEGTMVVKDTEGNVLSSGTAWFRGDIASKSTSYFNVSWNMDRTDAAVKIWNSDCSELVITYRITEIQFDNGITKEYTGKDIVVNQ